MTDALYLFAAFILGCTFALAVVYVVASAYALVSGKPGPTGTVSIPEALPYTVTSDALEASRERQILAQDETPGLGR